MALTPDLTEEQQVAAQMIRDFIAAKSGPNRFTMHGLAGTGKTTVLSTLAHEYPQAWLCALAGKAADVLRRKTGLNAMTMHSAFYKLERADDLGNGKHKLEFREAHEQESLLQQVVFLDESSMISESHARDMLRTGVKIVASGDPGQLPPVSGLPFFTKPDVTLKTIHRQALESPIIRQAHRVRNRLPYETDGDGFQVVRSAKDHLLSADIVLCWKNATRHAANAWVRRVKGFTDPNLQPGEPMMCLKNAPDYGIYNGGIYPLTRPFCDGEYNIFVEVNGVEVMVPYIRFENMRNGIPDGAEQTTSFTLAYCSTCHKSQGSEWDKVVLLDEYSFHDDREKWLYTGITRAAQQCIVVRQ